MREYTPKVKKAVGDMSHLRVKTAGWWWWALDLGFEFDGETGEWKKVEQKMEDGKKCGEVEGEWMGVEKGFWV